MAVPITWDELDDTAPDAFSIHDCRTHRPDPLLELAAVDPAPLMRTVDEIVDDQHIVLEHIDRFGRRWSPEERSGGS